MKIKRLRIKYFKHYLLVFIYLILGYEKEIKKNATMRFILFYKFPVIKINITKEKMINRNT